MKFLRFKKKQRLNTARAPLRGSREGFTLLELMVSMAVLGLIVLIVAAAMKLGFRSVEAGEKRMDSIERTRASLTLIEYQIQSEIPLFVNDNGTLKSSFTGDKTSLQFFTNYSIWGGEKGYVSVSYSVESDSAGKKILSVSENIIGVSNSAETRLLNGYDDIFFEYFYKDPTEEEGQWVEKWPDDTSIPDKVRIHLVNGYKDYTLIVPMRARGTMPVGLPAPTTTTTAQPQLQMGPLGGR
ncbi:MAG: prepilin-type N-terminal cleavage/methylation domain-containing protein [Thermodesulfovibrionales bacterium]